MSMTHDPGPEQREQARSQEAASRRRQARIELADDLLAHLIDSIGTGSAMARLRADALRIKHVLRGLSG